MSDLVERLRQGSDDLDVACAYCDEAADRIEELEAQLPAEMQNCTIRFMECEKGHGRLTATNWVQQGCHYCRIEELEATLDVVTAQLNHNTDLMHEATARIAVMQKSLRDVTRLWYKQKETIELLQTALQEKATLQ